MDGRKVKLRSDFSLNNLFFGIDSWVPHHFMEGSGFAKNNTSLVPLYPVRSIEAHNDYYCAIRRKYHSILQLYSNQAACNKMMTVVQVLQYEQSCFSWSFLTLPLLDILLILILILITQNKLYII